MSYRSPYPPYFDDEDEFDVTDMLCPGCNVLNPDMKWEDFGIGFYEYAGAPGYDIRWDYVTRCCEASVEDLIEFRPEPNDEDMDEEDVA